MRNTEEIINAINKEIGKVIVGQRGVVKQILVALLCDGNALLEGYPGLAKTLAIKSLARLLDLSFSRIQATPDLMPSDITGTYIIEESNGKRQFKFQKGPIFANVVLADEINRATPKTQSALLEAMQEKQVTVGSSTFKLDLPFFLLATQNPIEQEGTYPLPEAQADRFLLKIRVTYPDFKEEMEIVDRYASVSPQPQLRPILNKERIRYLQNLTKQVPIANDIKTKALKVVTATRNSEMIDYGASPRASIALVLAAKAHALLSGRNYVSSKDIEAVALPVLRHRIVLSFDAERKGVTADDVISELLKKNL